MFELIIKEENIAILDNVNSADIAKGKQFIKNRLKQSYNYRCRKDNIAVIENNDGTFKLRVLFKDNNKLLRMLGRM